MQLAPINMHLHSHFSFNAEGLSPTDLVREAARRNLHAIAICDFDVLDGLEELYQASDKALLRAAAGMETRVFFPEYGDIVINSPGEPGVCYFMGMGFGRVPPAGSIAGNMLARLRERASERNRALIARINSAFPEIAVDYDRDVLPLTPSGNATERHIVRAYIRQVRARSGGNAAFERETWSGILGFPPAKTAALIADETAFQDIVRARLMKRGGAGYVQPDSAAFPPITEVVAAILEAGAIPMATWLDGLNPGEADMESPLEYLRSQGVGALNMIPDRNWNIADPALREIKIRKLHETAALARRMNLPLNAGTELNNFGQPFVDDFESDAMRPLWPDFFRGANIMIGQARLARYAGVSYSDPRAQSAFGSNTAEKNALFERLGLLPCLSCEERKQVEGLGEERAFDLLIMSARRGEWDWRGTRKGA